MSDFSDKINIEFWIGRRRCMEREKYREGRKCFTINLHLEQSTHVYLQSVSVLLKIMFSLKDNDNNSVCSTFI